MKISTSRSTAEAEIFLPKIKIETVFPLVFSDFGDNWDFKAAHLKEMAALKIRIGFAFETIASSLT
jgi:hypothetical protein